MRQLAVAAIALALAGTLTAALAAPAYALDCDGTALPDGCLFTITGGDTPNPNDGFAVTNADGVPMWEFVSEQDLQAIGYPISQRWSDGPFTLQAFQKVILQWDPGKQRVNWYNTLDALANKHPDVELPNVPPHQILEADQGVNSFGTIIRNHLAILDANPTIKAAFLAEPNWLNLYGLPIAYDEREVDGNPQGLQVLRAQRTVFAIWNVLAPGTTIGSIVLQNVPDKIKPLSNVIIPDIAKTPISLKPTRDLDLFFADALGLAMYLSQSGIANLQTQPWFNEHITDRQKAWVVAITPFSYERPIEAYYIGTNTITMDDGRNIHIWIVKETPFDEGQALLQRVEDFVRISEEFLGISFPTTDIVITIGGEYLTNFLVFFGVGGRHLGNKFILRESRLPALEHELAHYFANGSFTHPIHRNRWQSEGGSEFLSAYVKDRSGRDNIAAGISKLTAAVNSQCIDELGVHTLYQLNNYFERDWGTEGCPYPFGDLFFRELLTIVGDTALGRSLAAIYTPDFGYGAYGYGTHDEELYQILLTNAPEGTRNALSELYRRLHGAPFTSATPEPVQVSLHPIVAPVLIELLPWAENPPDSHHADALKALVSLWWIDNDLMIDIAQFNWLADGINHKELSAIDDIRRIAATDVDLGKLAASYSWIVDDIKHWEDWPLRDLRLMVDRNSNASSIVMHYPWMKDTLSFLEAQALQYFRSIIQKEYWNPPEERGIAEAVATLPWIADGLSRTESVALSRLSLLPYFGKDLFIKVMSVPWIADGISSGHEVVGLELVIYEIANADPGLAKAVLDLPWTADGWDFVEQQAVARIAYIFSPNKAFINDPNRAVAVDSRLGFQLLSYPWFTDGINGHEQSALGELRGLFDKDTAFASRILGFGWFRDNITDVESRALHHLHRIASRDVELARQFLTYPWVVDGVTEGEVASLATAADSLETEPNPASQS